MRLHRLQQMHRSCNAPDASSSIVACADGGLAGVSPYGQFSPYGQPSTTVIIVAGRKLHEAENSALPTSTAPDVEPACPTAAELLASTPGFSLLSGLVSSLSAPFQLQLHARLSAYTFFAPTDHAVMTLLAALPDAGPAPELVRNSTLLTALLSYHFIPGAIMADAQLSDGQVLSTALGGNSTLRVHRAHGGLLLGGVGSLAAATDASSKTCSGVIHPIDTVLLPVTHDGKQQRPADAASLPAAQEALAAALAPPPAALDGYKPW